MSKKSRKARRAEMKKQQEQQVALTAPATTTPPDQTTTATAPEGAARPSIAALVLQRISKMGVLQQVDKPAETATKQQRVAPAVKTAPLPDSRGMPVIPPPQEKYPDHWPKCPEHVDPIEWQRALENKEYYETLWLEGDGQKPWFQYPRHPYQYSEFVYCTPEMMEALLRHMPVNRPMKASWVEAIKRDILHERWLQTHESIAINKNGNMHDGQHRAKGVIAAGRGWPIYVTWNVPPEAIYVTDSGEKRKINEKLGLLFPESKLTHRTAALCRSMMWGLSARGIRYSESEIAEFAVKYHDVLMWVTTNLRGYRADLQAVVAKSLLWWGEATISPFVNRLRNIQFAGEGDPAKALYVWLQKAKQEGRRASYTNPTIYYKKALSAIWAHANEKEARKIYQKQDDIFEWLPGWEVPPGAPCQGQVFTQTPPQNPTESNGNNDAK